MNEGQSTPYRFRLEYEAVEQLVALWSDAEAGGRRRRLWDEFHKLRGTIVAGITTFDWRVLNDDQLQEVARHRREIELGLGEFLPARAAADITPQQRNDLYLIALMEQAIDHADAGADSMPPWLVLLAGAPEIAPDDIPLLVVLRATGVFAGGPLAERELCRRAGAPS